MVLCTSESADNVLAQEEEEKEEELETRFFKFTCGKYNPFLIDTLT